MSLTHYNGVSVVGSGLAFGPKNLEQVIVDCSGYTTSALNIQPQSLDQVMKAGANTGIKTDGGSFGCSGWSKANVSTWLSSVLFAMAVPVLPTTGLAALASGWTSQVGVQFSGNQLDFTMYYNTSGGIGFTSAGTSSLIAWFAAGI